MNCGIFETGIKTMRVSEPIPDPSLSKGRERAGVLSVEQSLNIIDGFLMINSKNTRTDGSEIATLLSSLANS